MADTTAMERFLESAKHPMRTRATLPPTAGSRGSVITISRQAGSGAHVVAEELVARLRSVTPEDAPTWTVFDRNLVDRVLEDHELPDRLAGFMPEDRVSGIADTVDELFGLRPSSWVLVRKTADTILRLAEIGNVVVIGRGAAVITAKLASAFHVRLVGSVPKRIAYVQEQLHLGPERAVEYVREQDRARSRYVRKYYDRDVDDPLLYHLVINTDLVSYADAARVIVDAVRARQEGSRAGQGAQPEQPPASTR
ncbi:MAG: cytidylate kinase-like family protein [Actinomycetota bacterium]